MANDSLTEKQGQALAAIKDGADVKGVADALGISPAGAHSHIAALKKKGYLDADGKLTSKVVTGRSNGPKADKAPEAPAEAPSETPEVDLSGNGDGPTADDESFSLDQEIAEVVAQRRQELATTIAQIEQGIARHQRSVTVLTGSLDQARQALSALESVAA